MKKFSLGLAGLALLATPALADNTDQQTVTVSGTIVASLDASVTNNLTMPHLVKPNTSEGATGVTVQCSSADANNVVSYTGGGNPYAAGNNTHTSPQSGSNNGTIGGANKTGTCATVLVSGDSNYYFGVVTAVTGSPPNMTLSAPTCYDGAIVSPTAVGGTGVQLSGGSKTLKCGATITANSSSAASYTGTGTFTVTVTYD